MRAETILRLLILCFIGPEDDEPERNRREAAIIEVHPDARVVFRRGDVFTGWRERELNGTKVDMIDPGPYENLIEPYALVDIPAVKLPAQPPAPPAQTGEGGQGSTPPAQPAGDQPPPPPAPDKPAKPNGRGQPNK